MIEYMKCQQTMTTPFANRPFQPKPKAAAKKHNLVPLTRLNRAKLSQPRRMNVGETSQSHSAKLDIHH